jgi:hypothetical protein
MFVVCLLLLLVLRSIDFEAESTDVFLFALQGDEAAQMASSLNDADAARVLAELEEKNQAALAAPASMS